MHWQGTQTTISDKEIEVIDINELTIGQIREIAATFPTLFGRNTTNIADGMVGKYAIVRCYSAGVHAGTVAAIDNDKVILKDSRRLWSWKAVDGVALSGVAQFGIIGGKIDSMNPEIYLTGVIEIIPCTNAARESIRNG